MIRFQPTYKDLKRDSRDVKCIEVSRFQPTYKDLKHDALATFAFVNASRFQPTYKDLKLAEGVNTYNSGAAFSAYL